MKRIVAFAVLAVFGMLPFAAPPAVAETVGQGFESDVAQARPRTRLRVRPLYPRQRYHSLYPPPYDVRYPGPNARRECVARYVKERRPSGAVITPRMNCWWVRS